MIMAKEKILIVEDEEDILELVGYHLQQEGYMTIYARSGDEALDMVAESSPDLIVLDIMLPRLVGTEVCKTLKQNPDTRSIPVIMLTAKSEEIDRVVGFELGADDYVTKPFSPRELVLRVKAILKRMHAADDAKDILQIDGITIDKPKHRVNLDGRNIDLTATEFSLLLTLVERKGRVQTRNMLLETVWGYQYTGYTRTVDTHMRRLRAKLGRKGDCIETVRGIGYRFRETES
jgi:two-component system phosphate regulon response regulator PhoB